MSIRADTWGAVGCVQMSLKRNGQEVHKQKENAKPFCLNGDGGWTRVRPFNFNSGSHTIEATAYPYSHCHGLPSETKTIEFVIS